jgi:hypothetical protein
VNVSSLTSAIFLRMRKAMLKQEKEEKKEEKKRIRGRGKKGDTKAILPM